MRVAFFCVLSACGTASGTPPPTTSSGSHLPSAPASLGQLQAAIVAGQEREAILFANRLHASGRPIDKASRETTLRFVDAQSLAQLIDLSTRLQPAHFPASAVAYRRVAMLAHMGKPLAARAALALIADDDMRARGAKLIRTNDVRSNVVAVLLPLSGRFENVGKELKTAIELAAKNRTDIKLVFVDTRGDETQAALAVDTVVTGERPLWILGPVGKRESRAAARRAAILGVPMALLSPIEGLAAPREGIVRLVGTGADRAGVAARAALALGFAAPATMVPRTPKGRAQAKAFADAARQAGNPVVRAGTYDPSGAELEEDMRQFLLLEPQTNVRLAKHLRRRGKSGWKTFSPDVPFDVLFIPDRHDRAVLVASFLRYFNVELRDGRDADVYALKRKHGGRVPTRVQLVGGAGWHHLALLAQDPADIEGALIVDVMSGSGDEEYPTVLAAEFAENFFAQTGREPSALALEAYDATLLAFSAHDRAHIAKPSRKKMRQALRHARVDHGTTGPMHVDPMGRLSRRWLLLRVESQAFVLQDLAR